MSTRVYVPSSTEGLSNILLSGGVGPVPFLAHAVTDDLRSALPDAGEEEWEYAALMSAAQDSLGLITDDDRPRRVVVVAEADTVVPVSEGEPSLVEVVDVVPLRSVVAVHVDSEDAEEDVSAAREVWQAAQEGDAADSRRIGDDIGRTALAGQAAAAFVRIAHIARTGATEQVHLGRRIVRVTYRVIAADRDDT